MDPLPTPAPDSSQSPPPIEPYVGQQFNSIEDAYEFYNEYAKHVGFSTRISYSKQRKGSNEIYWKSFVCYKQGSRNESDNQSDNCVDIGSSSIDSSQPCKDSSRNHGITRIGCKAKICIVKSQEEDSWKVSVFYKDHNHVLATPRKVPFLRSHRNVSLAKQNLSRIFFEANVQPHQRLRIFEIETGGLQNVGFTHRDLINYDKSVRENLIVADAETLLEYFLSEKEKNPSFYYSIDTDEHNQLRRCFWADVASRRSWSYFGDVVVFDTTYNTNKYCMIFAPFVGVNHHGQSILFGAGFLGDETTESFVWLFNQWLSAMPSGPPKMIITYQNPAIAKAVIQVLPTTFHWLCIWHIVSKFSDKIGHIKHMKYWNLFKVAIWGSETPSDFEASWENAVSLGLLWENQWLQRMYGIRHRWVPAYVNHIFSAGMTSSQHAESSHSFFRTVLSNHHSLIDFITRFNHCLAHQRCNELQADHVDVNEKPCFQTRFPMEQQMADVYTKANFMKFQTELVESETLIMSIHEDDESKQMFLVQSYTKNDSQVRLLSYDRTHAFASCSCRLFECAGIPCRHILLFFRSTQIPFLPDKYILLRLTKEAKQQNVWDDSGVEVRDVRNIDLATRHERLSQQLVSLIDGACLSLDGYNFLRISMQNLHLNVRDMNKANGISDNNMGGPRVSSDQPRINNPPKAKAKGSGSRIKYGKEKQLAKGRHCNACGKRGVAHDKRNCPSLQTQSGVNDDMDTSSDEDALDFTPIGDFCGSAVDFEEGN